MKRLAEILILTVTMLVLILGCGEDKVPITSPDAVGTTPADPQTYDMQDCETGRIVHVIAPDLAVYDTSNSGEFERALQVGEVQAMISKFASLGYETDLSASLIMEGIGIPNGTTDSIAVQIVSIVLRYLPDSTNSYVCISHIRSTNRPELPSFVNTAISSFVPPETDIASYDRLYVGKDDDGQSRYIWMKELISPFSPAGDSGHPILKTMWSWRKWLGCTIGGAIAASLTGAYKCLPAGPGYLQCVGTWAGIGLGASAIGCAVNVWISGN